MHSARTTNAHDFGCSVRHGFFHLYPRRRERLNNIMLDIPLLCRLEKRKSYGGRKRKRGGAPHSRLAASLSPRPQCQEHPTIGMRTFPLSMSKMAYATCYYIDI